MATEVDGAICFWNSTSGEVKITINLCKQKGSAYEIIRYKDKD